MKSIMKFHFIMLTLMSLLLATTKNCAANLIQDNFLLKNMFDDLMYNEEFLNMNDFEQRQIIIYLVRSLVRDKNKIVNVYMD